MNLVVDCREKKLISLLESQTVPLTVESLPLGDITIRDGDGNLIVLFERKTIQDLLSSISDGRYEEQSYRLQECGLDRRKIYYIIEGNIEGFIGKGSGLYSKSTVHSCLYSLTFIKGFSLICSNSLKHTSEIIDKFFSKIKSESPNKVKETTYIDSVKLTKKGNLSDKMVSVMMLAQIPKVSKSAAETVMSKFDYSISSLLHALENNDNCLNDISIPIANNKLRKLSKPCILNLKKYLLNISSE